MPSHRYHLLGILLAASGSICWSPDGLILRLVEADGWQVLFWRMSSLAFALAAVLAWEERQAFPAAFRTMGRPGLLAAVALAATNCLFTFAIFDTSVANALVLFATVPLFAAILGWLLLGERVPLRTAVTVLVGMSGIAAIFLHELGHGAVLGNIFATLAALLFAVNLVIVRRNPKIPLLPPFALAGLLGAILAGIMSDPFRVPLAHVGYLVASGAFQQTAALLLFLSGARYLPPAEVGLLGLVETVLGPFWVWLAIGEQPSSVTLVAGAVVILGLAVHSWLGLRADAALSAPAIPPCPTTSD